MALSNGHRRTRGALAMRRWQQQLHVRVMRRRERGCLSQPQPRFRICSHATSSTSSAATASAPVRSAFAHARTHERSQEALVQRDVQHEVERHAQQRDELSSNVNRRLLYTRTVNLLIDMLTRYKLSETNCVHTCVIVR